MVACPKCNGELNLPEGADQESIFDCPHCQASYPLSEARLSFADEDGPLLFDLDAIEEVADGPASGAGEEAASGDMELELDLDLAPIDDVDDDVASIGAGKEETADEPASDEDASFGAGLLDDEDLTLTEEPNVDVKASADKASDVVAGAKDLVGDGVKETQSFLSGSEADGEDFLDVDEDDLANHMGNDDSSVDDLDVSDLDGSAVSAADSNDVDLDAADLLAADVDDDGNDDDVDDVGEAVAESVDSLSDLETSSDVETSTDFGAGIAPLDPSTEQSGLNVIESSIEDFDELALGDTRESVPIDETIEAATSARADFEIEELSPDEIDEIDELDFSPVSEPESTEIDGEIEIESVETIDELDDALTAAEVPLEDELELGPSDVDDDDESDGSSAVNPLLGGAAALGAMGAVAKGAEIVKDMMGDAVEGAADVVGDVVEAGKDAGGNVAETGADLVDDGANLIHEGTGVLGDSVESVADAASNLTGSVSNTVQSGIDKLSDELDLDEEDLDGADSGDTDLSDADPDLDFIDFESDDDDAIEVEFGDAIGATDEADDLSDAAAAFSFSGKSDVEETDEEADEEAVAPSLVDDAIAAETPTEEAPVEVVKPFDLEPNPDQVPAKNYRPGLPHNSGGLVASLLKFGVGGLLGLLVAQAGMWWIGRIDPLNLASKLPSAVGFLAPDSLRNPYGRETAQAERPRVEANRPPVLDEPIDLPADMDTGSDLSNDIESGNKPHEEVRSGGGAFGGEPTDTLNGDLADVPDQRDGDFNVGGGDFTSDSGGDFADLDIESETPSPDAAPGNDVDAIFGSDSEKEFGASETLPAPTFGLVAKQNIHRNDLSGALGKANRAWESLMTATNAKAPRDQRRPLLYSFYDSVASMGQTAVHVDEDAGPVVSQMQVFMRSLGKFKSTMGKTAARRNPNTESIGIFLAGQVSNQETLGAGYQRFQIALPAYDDSTGHHAAQTFEVIAPDTSVLPAGTSVFVLGTKLNDPGSELAGFTVPTNGSVVWSDQIISL